jgi:hypothetical protein
MLGFDLGPNASEAFATNAYDAIKFTITIYSQFLFQNTIVFKTTVFG